MLRMRLWVVGTRPEGVDRFLAAPVGIQTISSCGRARRRRKRENPRKVSAVMHRPRNSSQLLEVIVRQECSKFQTLQQG